MKIRQNLNFLCWQGFNPVQWSGTLPEFSFSYTMKSTKTENSPCLFRVEYTDTFGGQANYSWIKRAEFSSDEYNLAGIKKMGKILMGISGAPGRWETIGETLQFKPYNSATVLFIYPAWISFPVEFSFVTFHPMKSNNSITKTPDLSFLPLPLAELNKPRRIKTRKTKKPIFSKLRKTGIAFLDAMEEIFWKITGISPWVVLPLLAFFIVFGPALVVQWFSLWKFPNLTRRKIHEN